MATELTGSFLVFAFSACGAGREGAGAVSRARVSFFFAIRSWPSTFCSGALCDASHGQRRGTLLRIGPSPAWFCCGRAGLWHGSAGWLKPCPWAGLMLPMETIGGALILCAAMLSPFGAPVRAASLQWLGRVSFSLYLITATSFFAVAAGPWLGCSTWRIGPTRRPR